MTMQTSQIQTKRLNLRRPTEYDLIPYTKYCVSKRSKYVGGPFTNVQAFEKLASMIGHWELRGFGRFVMVEQSSGRALGHFGALQLDTSEPPEITWTIWHHDHERKGFATEAGQAFKDYAAQVLGFTDMIAHVRRGNFASAALAERLGGTLKIGALPPSRLEGSVVYEFNLSH
ncbi:GNAT family N-acetyltransferase [Tateyamaria omphalii]|uniref:GNAT family N-acetyltransferase n=1 Tax=Tateyamaria omphalii TaxID=299262 RepID=UPI00167505E8|nr:GNAT family N-acetyltransferase [Tateyamaria omphalii]